VKPLGPIAYIIRARVAWLRDIGAAMAPLNAFLFIQGIETMPLRMRAHCDNTLAVAKYLGTRREVTKVIHPQRSPARTRPWTKKYLTRGLGGLCGLELAGGASAGRKFIDNLKMLYHVANIGDARSLAIHPASNHALATDRGRAVGHRRFARLHPAIDRHRAHRRHPRRHRPSAGRRGA